MPAPARKTVVCTNEECEFTSQRKPANATDNPCPRCSSAVVVVTAVVVEKPSGRVFLGHPLVDIPDVRVSLQANRELLGEAGVAGTSSKVVAAIVEAWAAARVRSA